MRGSITTFDIIRTFLSASTMSRKQSSASFGGVPIAHHRGKSAFTPIPPKITLHPRKGRNRPLGVKLPPISGGFFRRNARRTYPVNNKQETSNPFRVGQKAPDGVIETGITSLNEVLVNAREEKDKHHTVANKSARRILKALKRTGEENRLLAKGRKPLIPLSAPASLKRARDRDNIDLPASKKPRSGAKNQTTSAARTSAVVEKESVTACSGRKDRPDPSHPDEGTLQSERKTTPTAAIDAIEKTVKSNLRDKENVRQSGEKRLHTSDPVACPKCTCTCSETGTSQVKVTIRTQEDGSANGRRGRNVDSTGREHWLGPSHYLFLMGYYSSRYEATHD